MDRRTDGKAGADGQTRVHRPSTVLDRALCAWQTILPP